MRTFGLCPHCTSRLELASAPPPADGRCTACGGRYLVVQPAELELQLLPLGAEKRIEAVLDEGGLRGPALSLLGAGGLLAGLFGLVGLLVLVRGLFAEGLDGRGTLVLALTLLALVLAVLVTGAVRRALGRSPLPHPRAKSRRS